MIKIHSIETFGTHEGPGIRLVIFTQGCNWRCLYCHNPDTWNVQGGQNMTIKQIISRANQQKEYFGKKGGITVTGGEPTLQAAEILKLFKAAKKEGINTVLETNGGIQTPAAIELYKTCDILLLDVKHIDPEEHKAITQADNNTTLHTAEVREKAKKPMWLRYVLVPGVNDMEKYLVALGEHFKNFKTIEKLEILPYHTLGVYKYKELKIPYHLEEIKPPTEEQISKTVKILSKYFKQITVR